MTPEQIRRACNSAKMLERTLLVFKLKGIDINQICEKKLQEVKHFTCH